MKQFITKSIATALLSLFALTAFGQTNFIEFDSPATLKLEREQQEKLEKVQALSHYKNAEVVIINPLEKSLKEQVLSFKIPYYQCNLKYIYKNSIYNSTNDFSWYGELQGDDRTSCSIGSIHYVKRNRKTFGQIIIGNDTYEFIDIGNGKHLFYQINDKAFEGKYCGVDHKTTIGKIQEQPPHSHKACADNNTVGILVLFTPNANDLVADIQTTAELSVAQIQQAFQNSHISNSRIRVSLIDVLPFGFTETGSMAVDVDDLANDPAAQLLRAQNEADLVVMLVDESYGGNLGRVQAIGIDFDGSYALVQAPSSHSKKVFAHEVGHLLGGRHDTDSNGTIEHGYTFKKWFLGRKYGTIMVSGSSVKSKNRILHFSNPNVEYEGEDTGTNSSNDNETHFENTGPIISQFFPNEQPDFSIILNGPSSICYGSYSSFSAIVTCGQIPYTFLWQKSVNGINWFTVGSGQYYTHYQPSSPNSYGFLHLRLTVTDATGESLSQHRTIYLTSTGPGGLDCGGFERTAPQIEANIYPNPINSNSTLNLALDKEYSQLSVILIDHFGNTVFKKEFANPKEVLSITTEQMPLQTGIYYLKIISDEAETASVLNIIK